MINKLKNSKFVRELAKKYKSSNFFSRLMVKFSQPRKKASVKILNEKIDNLNYKVDLLMDYYFDPSKARKAFGERAQRQKTMMLLALEFKRICDKHNIEYWMDFGSLLGAKRHGGFIPWDEDVDFSMLFSDIEKYADTFKKELGQDFRFRLNSDEYAQIFHKSGMYLDIYGYEQNDERMRMKLFTFLSPQDRRSVPASIIFPTSRIEFEGEEFKAPADVDTYLRGRFGDYETLPKSPHPYADTHIGKRKIFYPDEKF